MESSGPVVKRLKAYSFELILQDAALVRFTVGKEFLAIIWDRCQFNIIICSGNYDVRLGTWSADHKSTFNCLDDRSTDKWM